MGIDLVWVLVKSKQADVSRSILTAVLFFSCFWFSNVLYNIKPHELPLAMPVDRSCDAQVHWRTTVSRERLAALQLTTYPAVQRFRVCSWVCV